LYNKKRRESEGGKKIVMVKLIIQKKSETTTESSVCLVKVLDLFLWHPILVLELGSLGFVGKGSDLLSDSLRGRQLDGLFFSTFLGLMGCPLQVGTLKWSH
jgi:hypothetical protein